MTPAEVCRKAAERIQKYGWCQGRFGECDGPVCLSGALRVVTGGHPLAMLSPHGGIAWDKVTLVVGEPPEAWNDRRQRKVEEVIAALLEAAERLEAP